MNLDFDLFRAYSELLQIFIFFIVSTPLDSVALYLFYALCTFLRGLRFGYCIALILCSGKTNNLGHDRLNIGCKYGSSENLKGVLVMNSLRLRHRTETF